MKKLVAIVCLLYCGSLLAQDVKVLAKQAVNYERVLKEDSAFLKYKEILDAEPKNMQALIRSSVLTTAAGARLADKKQQDDYYNKALSYAVSALGIDSNNADALYAHGLALIKKSEIEKENKAIAFLLNNCYTDASKALAANPGHGKANFLMGKWNFDIVNTAWTKKAAIKVLYGGIPNAAIDSAIMHMEKCRAAEPYFVQNFLELGKAYKFNYNPSKAIEVFYLLVKLPNRTVDDAAWKAEGRKLLADMQ